MKLLRDVLAEPEASPPAPSGMASYELPYFDPLEQAKVVIEIDGSSHDGRWELDRARQDVLEHQGYSVVRCSNREVFDEPDAVLLRIVYARVWHAR